MSVNKKMKGKITSGKSKSAGDDDDYDEMEAEAEIGKLGLSVYQFIKNRLQSYNQVSLQLKISKLSITKKLACSCLETAQNS